MSERKSLLMLRSVGELKALGVKAATRSLLKEAGLQLPMPGEGQTLLRWQLLAELGAYDLSVAKLAESHYDALSILHESCLKPHSGIYGVWASKFDGRFLRGVYHPESKSWKIEGEVAFASGISLIDYSIVPVTTDKGEILFQIPRSAMAVTRSADDFWQTPGMKDADTAWVRVEAELPSSEAVGDADFYLSRKGFWIGAVGVAACWLGAAQSLFSEWQRLAQKRARSDPHEEAARADSFCRLKSATVLLESVARLVDDCKIDHQRIQREALMLRHLVDRAANTLIENATRTMGPMLMVGGAEFSRRALDLQVFTRQCHAEKDLVHLAQVVTPYFQSTETSRYEREVWFE